MIDFSLFTDKGDREINEDSVQYCEKDGIFCFVLCDGLGGHGKGDAASSLVTKSICHTFLNSNSVEDFFTSAMMNAQIELLAEQKRLHSPEEMKTTAVVLVMDENEYRYAYIGDSRLYSFRKNKMKFRTLDHSVPQMLVFAGDIRERQIRSHPDRNRLLRVMGIEWDSPRYETSEKESLKDGDSFLLCSDGFWEPVTEKDMIVMLKKTNGMEDWVTEMTRLARRKSKGKEMDNFSCIAVQYKKKE